MVHTNEPLIVLPATALAGRLTETDMSAEAETAVLYGAVLLVGTGSDVVLPAVTTPVTVPLAGAV